MNRAKDSFPLNLMTFNIAHGRGLSLYQGFHSTRGIRKNLDRIALVIRNCKPDIVALQEVDRSSHWNKHINLLDYLQSATDYPFAEHGVHNERAGRKALSYGNAFLSRFPILASEVHRFGSKKIGEKGFMRAQFDAHGRSIDIINLHLDFRSRRIRLQQIERVVERLRESSDRAHEAPPIICGDFNTSSRASRDAIRQFVERVAEHTHYDIVPRNRRTFPSHFPSRGLDFVLLAKPYQAVDTQVIRCFASDHLPVVAKIACPAAASEATS